MIFFLRKGFDEKCKHTELALNFVQSSILVKKNTFSLHFGGIRTSWTIVKVAFKIFNFLRVLWDLNFQEY